MTVFSEKTSPFVLVLIVVFGFIAGYFYYGQISSPKIDSIRAAPGSNDTAFLKLKDMKLNLDLFDAPVFSSLQLYGNTQAPVVLEGRIDIFNP